MEKHKSGADKSGQSRAINRRDSLGYAPIGIFPVVWLNMVRRPREGSSL